MLTFATLSSSFSLFHPSFRTFRLSSSKCPNSIRALAIQASDTESFNLDAEIERARREGRPIHIDKSKLTPADREKLRLRSKAIPMVADKEPIDIVFEDHRFLVVNKPSYLKMHPSHRFEGGSLLNRAIGYCGFVPYILHRLDMHTTGVVVMAKRRELCNPIMKQFMRGHVKKQYVCLVDGMVEESAGSSFIVDAPIQRHEVSFMREVGTSKEDSKPAQTMFTVLDKSREKNMMLLQASPITGRTHQIRLHAGERSIPIVGDDLYNSKEHTLYSSYEEITAAAKDPSLSRFAENNLLRKGLKLHAWKIVLQDPATLEPLEFCAAPPPHMQDLLTWSGMDMPPSPPFN